MACQAKRRPKGIPAAAAVSSGYPVLCILEYYTFRILANTCFKYFKILYRHDLSNTDTTYSAMVQPFLTLEGLQPHCTFKLPGDIICLQACPIGFDHLFIPVKTVFFKSLKASSLFLIPVHIYQAVTFLITVEPA